MSGMPSGTITSRYQLHETAPVTEYVPHAVGGRFLSSHVGKPLLVTPIHSRFIIKETVSAPSYRMKTSYTNARSAGQSGGDDLRRTEVLAGFLRHDARHRINAVCPLCFCIVKDKPIVRRFDAAAHKDFLGKADFIRASGIVQRDFLRVRLKNEVIRLNDAAVLGIYLVKILLLRGVELQNVAGLARIAAQLLSGEHDLLRGFIKSRVL